jgi:hypothetical protein
LKKKSACGKENPRSPFWEKALAEKKTQEALFGKKRLRKKRNSSKRKLGKRKHKGNEKTARKSLTWLHITFS